LCRAKGVVTNCSETFGAGLIGQSPALDPVSCIPGTQFCVVIASDSANLVNGFHIGQAALVSTDAGQTWTNVTPAAWVTPPERDLPAQRELLRLSRVLRRGGRP
jgi:hypothetical protein